MPAFDLLTPILNLQMSVSGALEAAFVNLERGTGAINDDLAKLKADMQGQGRLPQRSSETASNFLDFGQDRSLF